MNQESKPSYSGLVAEWYDRLLTSEGNDVFYYGKRAAEVDGTILELACGTGRLLLPICRAGKTIDGIDISAEMLAVCREKLAAEGLSASLYEQDCTVFDTGRRYDMIFISGGSFQLIADLGHVRACLARVRAHLNPGGVFVLDVCRLDMDYDGEWRAGRTATDGDQELRCFHMTATDKANQIRTFSTGYELYAGGALARTEQSTMKLRWYEGDQLADELRAAGFSRVETHPESMMSTHEGTMVYSARV